MCGEQEVGILSANCELVRRDDLNGLSFLDMLAGQLGTPIYFQIGLKMRRLKGTIGLVQSPGIFSCSLYFEYHE